MWHRGRRVGGYRRVPEFAGAPREPGPRKRTLRSNRHPQYTPLIKVPDEAVRAAGVKFAVGEDANFRKKFGNPPELTRRLDR